MLIWLWPREGCALVSVVPFSLCATKPFLLLAGYRMTLRSFPFTRPAVYSSLGLPTTDSIQAVQTRFNVTTVTRLRERRLNRRIDQLAVIGVLN
jgi:hypothetical protein